MKTRILQSFHLFLLVSRYGISKVRPDRGHLMRQESRRDGGRRALPHLHRQTATTRPRSPSPASSGTAGWPPAASGQTRSEEQSGFSCLFQMTRHKEAPFTSPFQVCVPPTVPGTFYIPHWIHNYAKPKLFFQYQQSRELLKGLGKNKMKVTPEEMIRGARKQISEFRVSMESLPGETAGK